MVEVRYPVREKKNNRVQVTQRFEKHPNEFIYKRVPMPGALHETHQFQPDKPKVEAERLLSDFVKAAFRRPVSEQEVAPFLKLAIQWLDKGQSFEDAMRTAYRTVLTSPDFLYFQEPSKDDDQ
jgi:hypothetical protein